MLGKFKSMFSKESVEMQLSEVPEFLKEIEIKKDEFRLDDLRDTAVKELNKLKTILEDFSLKKAEDNYVNVLKNRFCEKGIKHLENLPDDRVAFIDHVPQALKEISGLDIKQIRHFHKDFKKDMDAIASQVKSCERKLDDFKKFYNNSQLKRVEQCNQILKEIKTMEERSKSIDTEISEIEKSIPFIKKTFEAEERKLSEAENKLASLTTDPKYEISKMESEQSIIKQRISTEFGAIDRALKKLQYDEPKKYPRLQDYITNPGAAFLEDENLEIRNILEDLLKIEDIDKKGKIADLLANVDVFDSLRAQYNSLTMKQRERKDEMEQEKQPLEKERKHAQTIIEERKQEIDQLLEKRDGKKEDKEKILLEISTLRAQLLEKLRELADREVQLI